MAKQGKEWTRGREMLVRTCRRWRAVGMMLIFSLAACSAEGPPGETTILRQPVAGEDSFGELVTEWVDLSGSRYAASTALSAARFVTAYKRGVGNPSNLQVTLTRMEVDRAMTDVHTLRTSHQINHRVTVARVDSRRFIVAAVGADGNLLIVGFRINDNDEIEETDFAERGAVTEVGSAGLNFNPGEFPFDSALGRAGNGHVVLSYRSSAGDLGLLDYSIDPNGLLSAGGKITAGAVELVEVTPVPGSQPVAAWHSRGPDASEQSATACQNGADDDGDAYVDCDDWDCCGNAACDGVGSCVQGTVVTATRNNATSTKLISWKVSAQGVFTRQRSILTGGGSVDATPQSFRRIATVIGDGVSQPVVSTWDVDPVTGALAHHSSLALSGTAPFAKIVNGGGARLFAWVPGETQGTLTSIDAIDTLRSLDSRSVVAGDWSTNGTLLSLSSDRAVLVFPKTSGSIEALSYRDFSQPLVRGSFEFATPNTATPQNNTTSPFAILSATTPNPPIVPNADASIAVGGNFVVACGNATTVIFDKAGNNLTGQTVLRHSSLFGSLLSPSITVAGTQVVNEQNVNRHLTFQYLCDGSRTMKNTAGQHNQCMAAMYDTDCTFDETTQRFVITSAVRPWKGDLTHRYLAIAVSKEADPRRGFNVYMTTDNKFDDNPAIAANGGMLVFSHQSGGTDPFDTYPSEMLKPSAIVFDLADLSSNAPKIGSSKISRYQTGGQIGLSVADSRGTFPFGGLFRTKNGGQQLFLFKRVRPGQLNVITNEEQVLPSGRGESNGWLQIDSQVPGSSTVVGRFYVSDRYSGAAGPGLVHVVGANITVERSAILEPSKLTLAPLPTSGEAFGCDANNDCLEPSMAMVGNSVYAMYKKYRKGYEACAEGITCASGVCLGSTCQVNPTPPSIYYTKFDAELRRQGIAASLLVAGGSMVIGREATEMIGNSAAARDPVNNSVWGIHAVPGAQDWRYAVAQFR